ncbi:HNH endonuclease [Rhodococcus hoagii]|nr:HNH endonuclease [Prescottella equi]
MAPTGSYTLANYLDPTEDQLRDEWRSVLRRSVVPKGAGRQVNFVPSEVVLALCASLLVDHSRFGSGSAHRAGFPVQHLAALYKRRPTSILAKMANLDGTRTNGGRLELEVSARMSSDSELLRDVYLRILRSARAAGIGTDVLPDFLELEGGEDLVLLGQEELVESEVERALESQLERWAREDNDVPPEVTQKLLISTARIGQHRFAGQVLANHGHRCVFCGLSGYIGGRKRPRLLTASHIKPWRSSSNRERLDFRNGLSACPTHDVAFDTGLITVGADLTITRTSGIEREMAIEPPLRHALGSPPLAPKLLLPGASERPDVVYLEWHRSEVFVDI